MKQRLIAIVFPILLFALNLQAQTQVAGLIDGETWSPQGNPYQVVGNVDVLQLTILPGVRIEFKGNYAFQVHGVLKVNGTKLDSVFFVSATDNAGGWQGIQFINASTQSEMRFCRISDVSSNPALLLNASSVLLENLQITNNGSDGLKVDNATVEIVRCQLNGNGGYGAQVINGGQLILTATRVFNNGEGGLQTSGGRIDLRNAIVAHNKKAGVVLSASGDYLQSVNAVIAYNNGEGVVSFGGVYDIENSVVYFNNALNQIAVISGSGQVRYSDVDQPNLGSTNLQVDPQFEDVNDFFLKNSSPLIDAGNPDVSFEDAYFPPSLGLPRNDIGAYGGPLARKWYAPLFVQPDSLQFGDVSVGDSLLLPVTVKNYGDQTMMLNSATLTGTNAAEFTVDQSNLPQNIAMAQSIVLWVTFHPSAAKIMPFEAHLVLNSSFGEDSVAVSGRGIVPDIFVIPGQLDFGAQSVGQSDSLTFKIYNLGTDSLRIDSLVHHLTVFKPQLSAQVLPAAADTFLHLNVRFEPDTIGLFRDTLRVFSNDPDESPYLLTLSGEGQAPVLKLSAEQVAFDSVPVQGDSVLTVLLENDGNMDLQIQQATVNSVGSPFWVEFTEPVIVPPAGEPFALKVHFNPDRPQSFADTLRIVSSDPFRPERKILLTGTGVAALLNVTPGSVDFGTMIAPDDSMLTLTLRNEGNIPLRIQAIRLEGNDAASFSWWKAADDLILLPGSNDSLRMFVRCLPQKSGDLSAHLTIVSNDLNEPEKEIPLTALVKAAELAIEPQTVSFDSTLIFSSVEKAVLLFNRGDYQLTVDSIKIDNSQAPDFTLSDLGVPLKMRPILDTLALKVIFNPQKVGNQVLQLRFYSNDPFQNPRILRIEGQGVEPVLQTSVDSLDFGALSVFRTQRKTLLLKNTGSATVSINQFKFLGSDSLNFFLDSLTVPLQLPAGSPPVAIGINFKPDRVGNYRATLKLEWNNPYGKNTTIGLSAYADSAKLIAPVMADFGKQVQKTSTELSFTIRNQSRVTVTIDSFKIRGSAVEAFELLNTVFPLQLEPSDSLWQVRVRYQPQNPGVHHATLNFYSQDMPAGRLSLPLNGISLYAANTPLLVLQPDDSLNFEPTFVSQTDTLAVTVVNLGASVLKIDSVKISNSSGFSLLNNSFSAEVAVDDSLQLPGVVFAPQNAGEHQARLQIFGNNPPSGVATVWLSGLGKIDSTPATVNWEPQNLLLEMNQTANLSIAVQDAETRIGSVVLFFKQGGRSEDFDSLFLQKSENNTWSGQLPATVVTETGVEGYLRITHGGRITMFPDGAPQNRFYLSVRVPQMAFPFTTLKEKYQMISLPFNTNQSLASLIGDELGPYDPEKYRLFDWDTGNSRFIEIKDLKSYEFKRGKALYLITRDPRNLNIEDVSSPSTVMPYNILVQYGWSMIANPFPFAVDWKDVDKGPAGEGLQLFYYNGNGWELASRMEPFKGYAVKIKEPQPLVVPPVASSGTVSKVAQLPALAWKIKLVARNGQAVDQVNFVGAYVDPVDNPASLEIPEPPAIGNYVSLYFKDRANNERWASDFRAPGKEGYRFDFVVEWLKTSTPAKVELLPEGLPQNWRWAIIDPRARVFYRFSPLVLSNSGKEWQLVVGPEDFVQQTLSDLAPVPEAFRLRPNYPNPFNSATTIRFELPAADHLTVEIFNIRGQRVRTLVQNRPYAAGYYRLKWDGRNERGLNVASGLYILRLKGQKFKGKQKILLQR